MRSEIHPQAIRRTWCPAAPLTGDGGEERSAYSSDKVVKFGVRDVSHGFICRLKALQAAYVKIYVLPNNGVCWTGYGTGGSNTPLLPELSELSLIESFQDHFSYLNCALKRSLGLALPLEAPCSTSSSKPGVNLLLL